MNNEDNSLYFGEIRKQFPILDQKINDHPFIYLDSAATSHKPNCVIDALSDFYRTSYGPVYRAIYTVARRATDAFHGGRKKIAAFLGVADENQIVFTRGATDSINLAAATFPQVHMKPGDEIIITEMEHHSNIIPWQQVAKKYNLVLHVVPVTDSGELDMAAFKKLLSPKTKMVACVHVSNVVGTVNPVKEITALAHENGATVLIDGAQSAPHLAINLADIDCDFFAFSGHKMYGPTGIGVLYGKKELLASLPPLETGGGMVEDVNFEQTKFLPPPHRFEAGTPQIAEVVGLGASVDFLNSITMPRVEAWENSLMNHALTQMGQIPNLTIIGNPKQRTGVITFTVDGVHPADMATLLDLRGIAIRTGHLCTLPLLKHFSCSFVCRASLGVYNNHQDIDSFTDSLKEVIKTARG